MIIHGGKTAFINMERDGYKMVNTMKSKRTLSGAVLIMVLTVMSVLIIILIATLAVVSAANQKTYLKFEENQAYYTARSVLDVFTENLMGDDDYIASGTTYKQGRALELEFYKIKCQNLKKDLGEGSNFTETGNQYAITPDLDYIEYTATLPNVSDGSSNYGIMADNNTAVVRVEVLERKYDMAESYTDDQLKDATTSSTPNISQIQTSIKNGKRTDDVFKIKITATVNLLGAEGVASVIYESEKVAPGMPVNGKSMTALSDMTFNSSTILGGAATMYDMKDLNTDGVVVGSMYAHGDFVNNNLKYKLGPGECIYTGKNIRMSNNHLNIEAIGITVSTPADERPFVYVKNGIDVGEFRGFGGGFNGNILQKIDLITNGFKVNNTGSDSTPGGGTNGINGDVYCTSLFTNSDSHWGVNVNGSVYVKRNPADGLALDIKSPNITGDIIVWGDVKINSASNNSFGNYKTNINGDLIVFGNANIQEVDNWDDVIDINIGGSIIIKGNAVIPNDWCFASYGEAYLDSSIGGNFHCDGIVKTQNGDIVDTSTYNTIIPTFPSTEFDAKIDGKTMNADLKYEIKLPSYIEPSGYITRYIPTYLSEYANYLKIDSTGNFKANPSPDPLNTTPLKNYLLISAEEMAGTSESDLAIGNYTPLNFSNTAGMSYLQPVGDSKYWIGNQKYDPYYAPNNIGKGEVYNTLELDMPGNYIFANVNGNFGGNNINKYLHITGGGTFNFYVEAGTYNGTIVVDDDTTVNFFFKQNSNISWWISIFNQSLYKSRVGGSDSRVVDFHETDELSGGITPPKIYYFLGKNSTMTIQNKYFLLGYVYAPEATITVNENGDVKYEWKYNGYPNPSTTDNKQFVFLGSIVVKNINLYNKIGMVYIPNSGAPPPILTGDPHLKWNAEKYTRS